MVTSIFRQITVSLNQERRWINLFNNIGKTELIVVAVVLVVLIGGKKLPDLTRGIAAAIKEFKRAFRKESDKKDQSE